METLPPQFMKNFRTRNCEYGLVGIISISPTFQTIICQVQTQNTHRVPSCKYVKHKARLTYMPKKSTRVTPQTAALYNYAYLLEMAWGIIANAGGGDWKKETCEWQEAAARWRDDYHATVWPRHLKSK